MHLLTRNTVLAAVAVVATAWIVAGAAGADESTRVELFVRNDGPGCAGEGVPELHPQPPEHSRSCPPPQTPLEDARVVYGTHPGEMAPFVVDAGLIEATMVFGPPAVGGIELPVSAGYREVRLSGWLWMADGDRVHALSGTRTLGVRPASGRVALRWDAEVPPQAVGRTVEAVVIEIRHDDPIGLPLLVGHGWLVKDGSSSVAIPRSAAQPLEPGDGDGDGDGDDDHGSGEPGDGDGDDDHGSGEPGDGDDEPGDGDPDPVGPGDGAGSDDGGTPPDGDGPGAGETTPDLVHRLSGPNRFTTAVALSQAHYPDGSPRAYVASGLDHPDALAGGVAAGAAGAPLLLTAADEFIDVTADELVRLGVTEVVILGGREAVSDAVVADVAARTGADTLRIGGAERFDTAARVALRSHPDGAGTVVVASGSDFADALVGAPVAARDGAPLLLVTRDAIPGATAAALAQLDPERIVVLGGEATISADVAQLLGADGTSVERRAGGDRFATAAELADGATSVLVTSGVDFPDALAAGAAAAGRPDTAVLLVAPDTLPEATAAVLAAVDRAQVTVVGGLEAVSDLVIAALLDLWEGHRG